jgi:hypothetical protein
MKSHEVIGICAFICGMVCAITSTFVVFRMVDNVNAKLPEERQFSHAWWYTSGCLPNIKDSILMETFCEGFVFWWCCSLRAFLFLLGDLDSSLDDRSW